MAWFRIHLTEQQQPIVNDERDSHPQEHVRRKMLVLWLLHCGLSRDKAAEVAGLGRAFNVLGTLDAVTRELIAVSNTTVVNTETMCQLLRKLASHGLSGPITLVLDNARYQRNAVVQALAASLEIELLYLPSYSPNLNLIERLWRFVKRQTLYGRYYPTFADFRGAVQATLDQLSSKHKDKLASLMTLNFQVFDNVSLLAA